MKAVVIHRHGGPEEMVYEDIATPQVGPDDVLIKLEAVGLNHFDLDVCDGISGYLSLDMPHILGVEGAGEVAETGAAVSAFRPGDRVMPFLTLTSGLCRHRVCNCALGMDNICLDFEKLGVTCWGTYAEYVKVSHHNVIRIPDGVSALDAAAGQVAFATAWELVVKKAQVRQGEDVLINAAGSGVGTAAVQCARLAGARVIATAGSDEKLARARQLGADEVINYNETPRIGDAVRELTEGPRRRCLHRDGGRRGAAAEPRCAGAQRAARHLRGARGREGRDRHDRVLPQADHDDELPLRAEVDQ